MLRTVDKHKHSNKQGVLLYYKYLEIENVDGVVDWFKDNCTSLYLCGRVRISPEGINATIGGRLSSLKQHIAAVQSNPLFQIEECDFKLAFCDNPFDPKITRECGFSSLSVKVVKDVVTLFSHLPRKMPSISDSGKHLSPHEFHSALEVGVQKLIDNSSPEAPLDISLYPWTSQKGKAEMQQKSNIVVLDARNIYESRIGKFIPPEGIPSLVPNIRQYSDLPAWIDSHEEQLQGSHIFMYCTGGVRCEMASAYIKMKGPDFKNVYQLSGGIQRYLEAYPDGGFFKGKNFVFDPRVSVGSCSTEIIGSCLICDQTFDDYSSRCRCSYCRMLVLVCNTCQAKLMLHQKKPTFVCELCQKNGCNGRFAEALYGVGSSNNDPAMVGQLSESSKQDHSSEFIDKKEEHTELHNETASLKDPMVSRDSTQTKLLPSKKLKILCLHGFRQNGRGLKGRLASFSKKLKHLAEFIFVDGPHELPFIYQSSNNQSADNAGRSHSLQSSNDYANCFQAQNIFPRGCKTKYAWLIAPTFHPFDKSSDFDETSKTTTHSTDGTMKCLEKDNYGSEKTNWIKAVSPFDPLQYQHQIAGWSETVTCLEEIFAKLGPFDGVLGFSQGASVAAILCTLQQTSGHKSHIDFRFVILCSGFPSPLEEFQKFVSNPNMLPINCPSLHVFGGAEGAADKQIDSDASLELALYFNPDNRVILQHSFGHIVPAKSPYMDTINEFLCQFL